MVPRGIGIAKLSEVVLGYLQGFLDGIRVRPIRLVDRNEFTRRQAAPGIKITPKAFGRDRRLPITNRYG